MCSSNIYWSIRQAESHLLSLTALTGTLTASNQDNPFHKAHNTIYTDNSVNRQTAPQQSPV